MTGSWGTVPMYSNDADLELTSADREILLEVARASIERGLSTGQPLEIEPDRQPPHLCVERATFVTLRIEEKLRGCMGALKATQPLIVDTSRNAYSAAFRDPRFPKLTTLELDSLDIHISVLSAPESMPVESEDDFIRQVRPGIDGLILYEGTQKGTLLPSVWESVPDPQTFLQHLKHKAGLAVDYWSNTIRFERYTTTSFGR